MSRPVVIGPVVAVVLVTIPVFPAWVCHAHRSRKHSKAATTGPGTLRLPRAQRLTVVGWTRRKVAASIWVSSRLLSSERNSWDVMDWSRFVVTWVAGGNRTRHLELHTSVLPLNDGYH